MTEKEKIRYEIERLYNQSLADENRQANRGLKRAASASFGKSIACKELLYFIDSMQKEPKECMYSKDNYTDEDRKVLCDGCEEECEFNKKEEPVSEDLDKEIDNAHKLFYEEVGWDSDEGAKAYVADWFAHYFANWQKQQMMKNAIPCVVECDVYGMTVPKEAVKRAVDNTSAQVKDEVKLIIIKEK